ncbi:MAG: ComF family protein [Candidatus Azambacteria bacterium]|nr:ComF family protein [Candidatus Azambacteria bacterium]
MLKNFLLDLIFPRYCLGCQEELSYSVENAQICASCFAKIRLNRGFQYKKKTALKAVLAAGRYEDPILREAIKSFKYQSVEALKKPLAKLAIDYLKKENLAGKFSGFVIAPIPLTLRRRLNRGFNQSELLAKEIGAFLNCPVVNLLKRKKFNFPQAEIPDWQKRKENIAGAFCLSPGFRSPDKIILIDDVSTSGATLEEAAAVLKKAGAKEIYGLVIAKG